MRPAVCALAVFAAFALPARARADGKAECAAAYETAQEHRQGGKLRLAREQLLVCAQAECPDFIRDDCGKWLGEVDAAMPSVVFVARDAGGNDLTDVKVSVGDDTLAEELDGRPIEVEPGTQTFKFEAAGHAAVEKKIVVVQGEKNRAITVTFGGAAPVDDGGDDPDGASIDGEDIVEGTDTNVLAYSLGAVGIVGLGGFAFFALSGNGQKSDLEGTCKPNCTEAQKDEVAQKYLFADISLGVGVVALGVATYLLLSGPSGGDAEPEQADEAVRVDLAPTTRGGYATVSGRF